MDRRSSVFRRRTSLPVALAVWLATVVLLASYNSYIAPFKSVLGDDIYLDLRIGGYDLEEVEIFLESLGPQWRAFYTRSTLFDCVWPLGMAVSGFLLAPLALRRKWQVGLGMFFPVAFGVLDLFENIGILGMIAGYPQISPTLVGTSNAFTVSKQLMLPGAFAAFLVLPCLAVARTWRGQKATRPGRRP